MFIFQVFEDMTVKVVINQADVSSKFVSKVSGELGVTQLVSRVSMAKVCPGIKDFGLDDLIHHPTVVQRGHCWQSDGCPIILDINNNVCSHCVKIRNAHRRRKAKERADAAKRRKE